MKKSLLALAVLSAITGAASAQSSVTLYGKIDLGLVGDGGTGNGKSLRVSSGVSGGSRLGFKGVEDLGGGLKASFQLETGFCADSNATTATSAAAGYCTGGGFMGRQAHGDLSGAFGAVSAGRQYTIAYNNLTTIDPFGTGFAGQVNNIVDASGIRVNNLVQYTTPTFAGFNISGEVGLGEQTGNWRAGRETGGGLTYAAGPAYFGATYYGIDNATGNTNSARKNYLVGGSYDFGVVKIHALGQKSTGDPTGSASAAGSGLRIDALDLMGGLTVPIGAGSLMASYIHHNDRVKALNHDATQAGVGYIYPLSKRTSLYTSFAHISQKGGNGAYTNVNPAITGADVRDNYAPYTVGNATENGTGNKSVDFGVVHNF